MEAAKARREAKAAKKAEEQDNAQCYREAIAKAEGTERLVAFNPNLVAPFGKTKFDPDEF
jgi:hypothetical protein